MSDSSRPLAALPAPLVIDRPADLLRMVERLRTQPCLAVDTESNSLFAYREQVCLVQFSLPGADYLVDPLALADLSPLGPIFADPTIQKVFHAAEYDIICLKRDFGFTFANLFDTMLAARILGWEVFGLGAILEQEFGVQADKRFQRANWGQRPLPPELLSYARLDTHFLVELAQRQAALLAGRSLERLAEEDFRRMTQVNGAYSDERSEDPWRLRGAHDLEPQQAAVLVELIRYRDQIARRIDRPPFKVIGDQTLVAIAAELPQDADALARLPGMTHGQMRRHGQAALAAVQRGLRAAPLHPPHNPRPPDIYLRRLEALREWRKQRAARLGVQSDVILPRELLQTIAERAPASPEALAEVMSDVPWRLERFGAEILKTIGKPGKHG